MGLRFSKDSLIYFSNDLQTVASAHLTFNADQKASGVKDFRMIPAGVNGVEDRMSVLWQHGVVRSTHGEE